MSVPTTAPSIRISTRATPWSSAAVAETDPEDVPDPDLPADLT